MVTVNNLLGENSGTAEMELKGLSTDTKPTGTFSGYNIGVNSIFIELDTGNIYYYNGSAWALMSAGGGGGGAGLPAVTSDDNGKVLGVVNGAWDKTEAESDVMVVTAEVDFDNGTVLNPSQGAKAIYDAQSAGKIVVGRFTHTEDGTEITTDMLLQSCIAESSNVYTGVFMTTDDEYAYSVLINTLYYQAGKVTLQTSGSNDYKVTFTADTGTGTLTADKSIADINTAAAAGKHVYAEVTITLGSDSINQRFALSEYKPDLITFYAVLVDEDEGVQTAKPVCLSGLHTGGADTWAVIE